MADSFTPRLGLTLRPDADPLSPFRENFSKIDKTAGHIWVADGVTPADADLFDGAIVHEITSDKVWIARSNGVGGYTKRYMHIPYMGVFTDTPGINSDTVYHEWPINNFASGVNASVAQIVSGRFVVPYSGIWLFQYQLRLNGSGTAGTRQIALAVNGGAPASIDFTTEVNLTISTFNGLASGGLTYTRKMSVGDTVVPVIQQSSGATQSGNHTFVATLVCPA